MQAVLIVAGLVIATGTLVAILLSIAHPERRLWPPKRYTNATPFLVWVPTFTLFGILIVLGIMSWGSLPIPTRLRFGAGIPLIFVGNVIVWSEVMQFGIDQTGGAKGSLRTDGMYRYSRNPQYVADIATDCRLDCALCIVWSSAYWACRNSRSNRCTIRRRTMAQTAIWFSIRGLPGDGSTFLVDKRPVNKADLRHGSASW